MLIFFRQSLSFVLLGIMIACVLRIITLALWMSYADIIADSIFNRLSWIAFVLTYMLLVFGWIETVHLKYPPPSDNFIPILKWIMLGIAAALFLLQMITLIVHLATRPPPLPAGTTAPPGGPSAITAAYDANIWIFNVFLLATSVAFLLYGIILIVRLNRGVTNRHSLVIMDSRHVARHRAAFLKIIIVMCVMCVCFALRLAVFMVRPLGGCLPVGVFWAFGYMIPEVIPAIVQMFVIISSAESKARLATIMGKRPSGISESTASISTADRPLLENEGMSMMELPEQGETFTETSESDERLAVERDMDDDSYSHIDDSVTTKVRSQIEDGGRA